MFTRNIHANHLLAVALLLGVTMAILWLRSDVRDTRSFSPDVQRTSRNPSEAYSDAASRDRAVDYSIDLERKAHSESRQAEKGTSIGPSPEMKELLKLMRRDGIVVPARLSFPDTQTWTELQHSWQALTSDVLKADAARSEIARRLSGRRLQDGRYELYKASDYPEGKADPVTRQMPPERRPWLLSNTADEWIHCRHEWDKTLDAHVVKTVRIPIGENAELDSATRAYRDALAVRKADAEYFFQTFNLERTSK